MLKRKLFANITLFLFHPFIGNISGPIYILVSLGMCSYEWNLKILDFTSKQNTMELPDAISVGAASNFGRWIVVLCWAGFFYHRESFNRKVCSRCYRYLTFIKCSGLSQNEANPLAVMCVLQTKPWLCACCDNEGWMPHVPKTVTLKKKKKQVSELASNMCEDSKQKFQYSKWRK